MRKMQEKQKLTQEEQEMFRYNLTEQFDVFYIALVTLWELLCREAEAHMRERRSQMSRSAERELGRLKSFIF